MILLGQLSLSLHQPVQALPIFTSVARTDPSSEEALHGLLTCATQTHDTKQAAAVGAHLAQVLARHDRMAHLTDQIRLNQKDIAAALEMARLEEQDGDPRMAEAFYDQAIRLAPDDARPRPALAAFLRRAGRPDEARQALNPQFVP